MMIEKLTGKDASNNNDIVLHMLNSTEEVLTPDRWRQSDSSAASWYFGSYKDAAQSVTAMKHGMPNELCTKAYDKARSVIQETEDYRIANVRRRARRDDTGDEVNPDAWLAGDERHWTTIKRNGRKRAITIGLMLWMTCGNNEDEFAQNTASGVAIADTLAKAGYAVRVLGVHGAQCGSTYRGFTHPLVEFGQPIDEHALMAYGQPAACRLVGFTWFNKLFGDDEMGIGYKSPPEFLTMAGVDIMIAKQWSADKQLEILQQLLQTYQ